MRLRLSLVSSLSLLMFAGRLSIWLFARLRFCSLSSFSTFDDKRVSWLSERFRSVSAASSASSAGAGLVRAWLERFSPVILLLLTVIPCHVLMRCRLFVSERRLPHVAMADPSGSVVWDAHLSRIASNVSQSRTSCVFLFGSKTLSEQIWAHVLFSVAAPSKRLFPVLMSGELGSVSGTVVNCDKYAARAARSAATIALASAGPGSSPVRQLLWRCRCRRLVSLWSPWGADPVRLLSFKRRSKSCLSKAMEAGMGPCRSLLLKCSFLRFAW